MLGQELNGHRWCWWGRVGALVTPGLVSPQIHWPASQQRIEECILSGKNSNVSGHHKPHSGSGGRAGGQHWRGIHVLMSYPGKAIPRSPVVWHQLQPCWDGVALQGVVVPCHSFYPAMLLESFMGKQEAEQPTLLPTASQGWALQPASSWSMPTPDMCCPIPRANP